MFTEISEKEFLSMASAPIQYIGIYELNWIMDDNLLDCEGAIVAFENRKILIQAKRLAKMILILYIMISPMSMNAERFYLYRMKLFVLLERKRRKIVRGLYAFK